ncbi:MAG TPA: tRNA uridine-5-carboxymethylaminomethyl(34) synthesis GTPase MnmE [Pseudacidobacterium sp.]|nr:tRNA uridine-5-carboxymethylaminomethyl(34) synthesis GTPase MnmE [Pseudacidobacterium sp.]
MQPNPQSAAEQALSANETIVAISTPPGRGGIGIVRLSGPRSLEIAAPLLKYRGELEHARARFAEIIDPETQTKLDEAVVTYFNKPNSYTAEDIIEIAAHGSPVILDLLVRQALRLGARLANPGEFTERAFLSGRIDLTQAEAVRDLIESQTLYQARVAAQQLDGALSRCVRPMKQKLVELIAILEAGIDFAEDDVDVAPEIEITNRIDSVTVPITELARSFEQGRIVHSGLALAIVGRPNVGKSSLFNRLVERERAIVTAMPGTTRDLVTERVSIGGIPIELIDTAGLREAADEAESIGIQKSREALADADLVLIVLDASVPLRADEAALITSLIDRRALVVANKCDLDLEQSEVYAAQTDDRLRAVRTSAVTGEGIDQLREAILDLVCGSSSGSEDGMLTSVRHHQAVTAALDALAAARKAVAERIPHEMLLLDLYAALRQMDSLTGETTSDDILNLIFSTFCIGK